MKALLRLCSFVPVAALFIIVTALVAPAVEAPWARLAIGALVCLAPALLFRKRFRIVLPLADGALAAFLAFGFADDVGRALRRHGDWFVGERNGLVARLLRQGIGGAAAYLERFDPAPELREAPVPQHGVPAWVHPLATRVLPMNESQRFGAARPQPRPAECELGHCGVDLVGPLGSPVHAVAAGVVEKIERDEVRGGRAGRYIIINHGEVKSRYIHLDTVDVAAGTAVRPGDIIGTLGQSGVFHSAPHLHFGLQIHDVYVDPEPYLRRWALYSTSSSSVASRSQ